MTTLNAFASLAEFKAYITALSAAVPAADATQDGVIEKILVAASQYLESQTARHFWPRVETHYYDVPSADSIDPRALKLDDDLLEVLSVVNGEGTTIPSTQYSARPRNKTPYTTIRLKNGSTFYWVGDGSGDTHDVIAVTGLWGYHERYSNAWLLGSTANEAMDTSETGYDVTSGTAFAIGNLIRFGDELGYVSAIATNTLTTTRGENGSVAIAHDTGINVYIWQVMEEARNACLEIANTAYRRRLGQNLSGSEQVTPAGVIIAPRDVPTLAQKFIEVKRNRL